MEIKNKVKGLKNIPVEEFLSLDFNTLKDSKRDTKKLENAIIKSGFSFPIIKWNSFVIDGTGRKQAIKNLTKKGYKIESIPCVEIEAKDLQEAKQKALEVSSQFGNITKESFLDFTQDLDLDFETFEIGNINQDMFLKEDEKEDEIPETPTIPKSKLGDLYILGKHRVLCGDSTKFEDVEMLMNGNKADMVFTDPPYGIDYSGGRTQVVAKKTYGKLMNDDLVGSSLSNLISLAFSFNKVEADVYICVSPIMQTPFLNFIESLNKKIDAVIVWDKKNAGLGYMTYRRQTEFILFVKGKGFKKGDKSDFDLWSIGRDGGQEYKHGTQKPVAVPHRALENSSKQEDTILDLFLGSGSTLIASEKTNRMCYGMELDPKYVDVIVKRYFDYVDNPVIIKNGIDDIKNWTN